MNGESVKKAINIGVWNKSTRSHRFFELNKNELLTVKKNDKIYSSIMTALLLLLLALHIEPRLFASVSFFLMYLPEAPPTLAPSSILRHRFDASVHCLQIWKSDFFYLILKVWILKFCDLKFGSIPNFVHLFCLKFILLRNLLVNDCWHWGSSIFIHHCQRTEGLLLVGAWPWKAICF